jgi:hypothetical protein
MILQQAAALLLALLAGQPEPPERVELAQVTIRQHIILRMPRSAPAPAAAASPIVWEESRGPRCLRMSTIAGAALVGRNSVDLVLRDNSRVRAELENSCPALDYYYGFYVNGTEDGQICADRDSVRSRMGGQCEIERFRTLRAVPRR